MYSGKTSALIERVEAYAAIFPHLRICIFGPNVDTRSPKVISSHNSSLTTSDKFRYQKITLINEIVYDNFDLIAIDEVQFFPDLLEATLNLREKDKIVIVSGLLKDFRGKYFGDLYRLVKFSDINIEKKAYCKHCVNELQVQNLVCVCPTATETGRIIESDEIILIGGTEQYIALCQRHFSRHTLLGNTGGKAGTRTTSVEDMEKGEVCAGQCELQEDQENSSSSSSTAQDSRGVHGEYGEENLRTEQDNENTSVVRGPPQSLQVQAQQDCSRSADSKYSESCEVDQSVGERSREFREGDRQSETGEPTTNDRNQSTNSAKFERAKRFKDAADRYYNRECYADRKFEVERTEIPERYEAQKKAIDQQREDERQRINREFPRSTGLPDGEAVIIRRHKFAESESKHDIAIHANIRRENFEMHQARERWEVGRRRAKELWIAERYRICCSDPTKSEREIVNDPESSTAAEGRESEGSAAAEGSL